MAQNQTVTHILFPINEKAGAAFSWTSVGLAVFTAFLQGLVTAIASMTEASSRWTFRFRLALWEHWWWTSVSLLLLASLVMNALSFASGTGGAPITVLALSAATFLAMVQYMVPAWQDRHYTRTRWWAWTGDSRTTIATDQANFCGDSGVWKRLIEHNRAKLNELQPTPSDGYGWRLWPVGGIPYDPTDILNLANAEHGGLVDVEEGRRRVGIYVAGDLPSDTVSLRWGREQHFRRRVSRAVSSMPLGLLRSSPVTSDGYDGKGLAKALGILGRNKGLRPGLLVFDMVKDISTHMENNSTWTPRPAKVLRSFYFKTLETQFHGIGPHFVHAAVELALLMADMPYWAIDRWLAAGCEHQSLETNLFLANTVLPGVDAYERQAALEAHYAASYVSMIMSLNSMDRRMKNPDERGHVVSRPDLLCLGLLLKAQGYAEPSWWNRPDVAARRKNQVRFLDGEEWKTPMARLLGLSAWPEGFANHPTSRWGPRLASPAARQRSVDSTATTVQGVAHHPAAVAGLDPLMRAAVGAGSAGIELQDMGARAA